MADLTKLILHSGYPAFKNNGIYTGSIVLPSTSLTTNIVEYEFPIFIQSGLDIVDVLFQGPNSSFFPRPSTAWFSPDGLNSVLQTGLQGGFPFNNYWYLGYRIESNALVITAMSSPLAAAFGTVTFSGTVTVNYRIIDYSAL